jgi:MFS family permease
MPSTNDFARLWIGQTVSQLGSQIGGTAMVFTAILTLNASPSQLGVLGAIQAVPVLLLGLLAGVWVDRLRRRRILIAADLGRALLLLTVPLAAAAGVLRIELLYIVATLTATLAVFFDIAYPSYVPSLVPPESLVRANSRLSASESLAEIVGPGIGGALVQVISAPFAVAFDALSFLMSALWIGAIRAREPRRDNPCTEAPTGIVANLRAVAHDASLGLRVSISDPILRALLGKVGTSSLAGGAIGTLYALYVVDVLGITPLVMGIVIGVGGLSSLLGAFVAERVVRRFGLGSTLLGANALSWASSFLIVLANGPLALPLLIASQAADAAGTIYRINALSLRQSTAPSDLLGRVNAGARVLEGVLIPVGALLGGLLAERIGVRAALAAAMFVGAASVLWIVFSPIRSMDQR